MGGGWLRAVPLLRHPQALPDQLFRQAPQGRPRHYAGRRPRRHLRLVRAAGCLPDVCHADSGIVWPVTAETGRNFDHHSGAFWPEFPPSVLFAPVARPTGKRKRLRTLSTLMHRALWLFRLLLPAGYALADTCMNAGNVVL